MELIYLAFILFIVGVAGTIVYDKVKAEKQRQAELFKSAPPKATRTRKPKVDQGDEEVNAFKDYLSKQKTKKSVSPQAQQIDQLIAQVKARAAAGEKKVTITKGLQTQTLTVAALMKELEDMKKKL